MCSSYRFDTSEDWIVPCGYFGPIWMREARVSESESLEEARLTALNMKKEVTSQGVWVGPRSWKSKETDSALDPPEGTQMGRHLDLSPVRLQTDRIVR